jgi:hypothetical protein
MPSVATPEYPIVLVNPTPTLPFIEERTATQVMQTIQAWPNWLDIKRVAYKEYGTNPTLFDQLLPEYQRFLGLIFLGYAPLGMFSRPVDEIWHSHVLCTHLYLDFCLRLHGRLINHVAQVPVPNQESTAAICTTCRSCTNCSGGGQGGGGKRNELLGEQPGTTRQFLSAYIEAYGTPPPTTIWHLWEAEGCATS